LAAGRRTVVLATVAASLIALPDARAQDGTPSSGTDQHFEVGVGGQASAHAFSLYSGGVWAPWGSIREDGWRLRAGGGWGNYTYFNGGTKIRGEASFADIMAGYHATIGALALKAYAGVAADSHALTPPDLDNALEGTEVGSKLALETWLNLGPLFWTAVDLGWASAHESYSGRARLGWRITPEVSIGVEGGAYGNVEGNGGHGAGFVRYEWVDGEVSATGGATGSLHRPDSPFGALNLTMKF
jgi:hypothetical protein